MDEVLAVLLALGAAALYGFGNALEHRVAIDVPSGDGLSISLMGRLARSPRWLFGMFGDVGAYGLQAAALAFGALLVVQPLLVCGLLVALPLSAYWNGRRLRPHEWGAAIVLCAALSLFLIEASPSGGSDTASSSSWLEAGGGVFLVIVIAVIGAAVTHGNVRAALLGFSAGALFGVTAALTKTFVEQIQHGVPYTARHWEVYALALFSIAGILLTQNGFHAASLPASLPALEATEPIVAAFLGVLVLHEHFNGQTTADNIVIALASVLVLVTVVVLAIAAGAEARTSASEEEARSAPRAVNRGAAAMP
jgi:drug/metabolite transporter (DMT)-like permease